MTSSAPNRPHQKRLQRPLMRRFVHESAASLHTVTNLHSPSEDCLTFACHALKDSRVTFQWLDHAQEFHELLTESFKEVDIEDQDYIEIHQLRGVLDVLVEDEVIRPFCEAELEQLTADMDAFNSGKISLSEFLDILTRRAKGADFTDAVLSRTQQKQLCAIANGTNSSTGESTEYSLGC